MAIDAMMLGPMLDPFRNMAKECEAKGYSGESYDEMMNALARMEELGEELSDFMEFSAKLSSEGLQLKFSTAYGNVLSEAASGSSGSSESSGNDYDDKALLKQNIDSLRNAIEELKRAENAAVQEATSHHKDADSKAVAENEVRTLAKTDQLIGPIEDLIALGESGISFPEFLRIQIEKGLDKAMNGDAVIQEGIAYDLDFAKASSIHPYDIQIREEQMKAFERLAAQSPFGLPNHLSMRLAFDAIVQSHVSAKNKWETIDRAWNRIFSLLDTWVIAHTSFAPSIDPWAMSSNPQAAVQRDKETLPGYIQERIRLLQENFGVSFSQILQEETFVWSVRHHHFSYSQVYTEFLISKALPLCKPEQLLSAELVQEVEQMYNSNQMPNPENYKVLDRQEAAYNKHFGEGQFVQKVGPKPSFGNRAASPWTL
ncbi:MAG: hypothetical protein NXI10_01935 [bacterium]|nr:hypothetical protein [bacterium]